jgi:16S rRNA (cytosine967-C5)-methyltransferase
MSREHNRLRNLLFLVDAYTGQKPLQLFLQEQFRTNKSWGSSDRRFYREWLYAYMRLGTSCGSLNPAERFVLLAWKKKEAACFEAWSGKHLDEVPEIKAMFPEYKPEQWFPRCELLSPQISLEALHQHFEHVLPVYARILPNGEKGTMNLPPGAELLPEGALRIPPATDLSEWIEKGFLQVQDWGSQLICQKITQSAQHGTLWDACSGSGGKSLNYACHEQACKLYCSDIRSAILHNLKQRFTQANLSVPFTAELNLELPHESISFYNHAGESTIIEPGFFDYLALDVPCSGSGTWGRNPEMLMEEFQRKSPEAYAHMQRNIVAHALPFLKPGGTLFYSTCSIYAVENEDNAAFFREKLGLKEIEETYIQGAQHQCDYLYLAKFQKA